MVKNLPANAEDVRDAGSIPGFERSPGGGHGNPFHYSCLENPQEERREEFQVEGTQWAIRSVASREILR